MSNINEAEIKKYLQSKNDTNTKSNQSVSMSMNMNEEVNEFELSNLRLNGDLTKDDWAKIIDILSKFENCNEPYLLSVYNVLKTNDETFQKQLLERTNIKKQSVMPNIQNSNPCNFAEFKYVYEAIMRSLLMQVEKGNDKVFINFSPPENLEKYYENHFKKKAYCLVNTHEEMGLLLEQVEYLRDKKIKKLKLPNIEIEGKIPKIYQTKVDYVSPLNNVNYGYSVILEDVYGEFFIWLKFLDCFFRVIFTKYDPELDCKIIHMRFNELNNNLLNFCRDSLKIPDKIQFFDFDYFEEEPEDTSNINENM